MRQSEIHPEYYLNINLVEFKLRSHLIKLDPSFFLDPDHYQYCFLKNNIHYYFFTEARNLNQCPGNIDNAWSLSIMPGHFERRPVQKLFKLRSGHYQDCPVKTAV